MTTITGLFSLIFFFNLSLLLGDALAENVFNHYQFLKIFGGKGSENGQLVAPHSLDIDKEGNVYVTDTGNNRIQKYDSDGNYVLKWGEEGSNDGQFIKLHDIAVDPSGKYVYTLELKNHRVQKFTSDGKFVLKWGFEDTGGKAAQRTPHQVSIDSLGYVYLTDKNSHQIIKFGENGEFIKVLGARGSEAGQFYRPHGIVFDANNNMYITDMRNSRV